ncbi:MAG: glutathione S-transferase family protein [Gammaproteobacteria bacterium]
MKLYWCPRTRASRAVWCLEEVGEPYERVLIDVRDPDARTDAGFRAASPMGKVPALEDGEVRLADSAAICLYLADRYAAGSLAPTIEEPDRGRFLFWMFFAPGAMEPAMAEKMGGWETNRGSHGWGDFQTMMQTLEEGLEPGPWLLGDRFSVADVMVGSTAAFMGMFGILPDSARVSAYVERCLERPAYRKAMALEES